MLLAAINHPFNLGARPLAVTTPVRLHNLSGTWDEKSTVIHEDLYATSLPPTSESTRKTYGAAKKAHHFSTLRIPRLSPHTKSDVRPRAPSFIPSDMHDPASLRVSPTSTIQTPVPVISAGAPVLEQRTTRTSRHAEDPTEPSPTSGAEPASPPRAQRFPLRPESPLAHARRRAGPNASPAQVETFPTEYRLAIALPRPGGAPLAPEMITVSVRRGARLAVVADAWHLEHDCHYEWHIAFSQPDVHLGAVRARFGEDGMLVIDVPRRPQANRTMRLA